MGSGLIGHQCYVEWRGETVLTLADLVPEVPRAMVVGINPAPRSVAAGHYYQGRLGQGFFKRLRLAGVLPESPRSSYEDDLALEHGIGFTDIVQRPTASADGLDAADFAHGLPLVRQHLQQVAAPLTIFTFKKTAEVLLGRFHGAGLLDATLEGSTVFVMPGPYETRAVVAEHLATLARTWRSLLT